MILWRIVVMHAGQDPWIAHVSSYETRARTVFDAYLVPPRGFVRLEKQARAFGPWTLEGQRA